MPAVEAREVGLLGGRNDRLVEGGMGGMFQFGGGEAFVVVDCAVADELDLGDARDGFEVGVEDGFLGASGLVVTVAIVLRGRVKGLERRINGGESPVERMV